MAWPQKHTGINKMAEVSDMDLAFAKISREHLTEFLKSTAQRLASESGTLLEVGSQEHFGARQCFHNYHIETFDIVDVSMIRTMSATSRGSTVSSRTASMTVLSAWMCSSILSIHSGRYANYAGS